MNSKARHHRPQSRRDLAIAAACGLFVALMVGAAYAAVPFYSWFCRVTGFAGTTQVATAAPTTVLDRRITVRFDGNVMGGLPWRFEPEQIAVDVKIGEVVTIMYRATNESARDTVGQAAYNVTPLTIGSYFQKINCFCFTEQRLKAGETREMPVVFYVDPSIARDADGDKVDTITLSYSFYPVREPEKPVSGATPRGTRAAEGTPPAAGAAGRI